MEIEYNHSVHRETASSPVDRFAQSLHVLRPSPSSESLHDAFRLETTRTPASERWNDLTRGCAVRGSSTVPSLPRCHPALRPLGPRPSRSGRPAQRDDSGSHLSNRQNRKRRWSPRRDRARSSSTCRPIDPAQANRTKGELPPLLKRILEEYSATGMPPAYLPKTPPAATGESS